MCYKIDYVNEFITMWIVTIIFEFDLLTFFDLMLNDTLCYDATVVLSFLYDEMLPGKLFWYSS